MNLYFLIITIVIYCNTLNHLIRTDTIKELWKEYEKIGFMHDLEHLKEEANNLLHMQQNEEIPMDTAAFYYTKLHDFDNNGGLDGNELLLAVRHSLSHANSSYEDMDLEELSGFVDTELQVMDLNNDGIVDYGEIYTYMEKAKVTGNQQQ